MLLQLISHRKESNPQFEANLIDDMVMRILKVVEGANVPVPDSGDSWSQRQIQTALDSLNEDSMLDEAKWLVKYLRRHEG